MGLVHAMRSNGPLPQVTEYYNDYTNPPEDDDKELYCTDYYPS